MSLRNIVRAILPFQVRTQILKMAPALADPVKSSSANEAIAARVEDLWRVMDQRLYRAEANFVDRSVWFDDMLRKKDKERWAQVRAFNERSDTLADLLEQKIARLESRVVELEVRLSGSLEAQSVAGTARPARGASKSTAKSALIK